MGKTREGIMKHELKLKVNGQDYTLLIEPNRTLLEVIREDLGLLGTKLGCGGGECGACTVILNSEAVKSCIMLALDARNQEIWTIEGLGQTGELHPLQRAFVEYGAIQCGYCTSGMIMASKALLDENPQPSEQEIKDALAGNLCRCTGYLKILEAISSVANKMERK
jgi:carbon-monoxide dehydrogenase small subunit